MGFMDGIIGSAIIGLGKEVLFPDANDTATTTADKKGLLAPPSDPLKTDTAAQYDVTRFKADTSFSNSSNRGSVVNAQPALTSASPVSVETQYWKKLFADSRNQAKGQ